MRGRIQIGENTFPFTALRYSDGLNRLAFLNCRAKCAESTMPTSAATSVILKLVVLKSDSASDSRRLSKYCHGVVPAARWKRRVKVLSESWNVVAIDAMERGWVNFSCRYIWTSRTTSSRCSRITCEPSCVDLNRRRISGENWFSTCRAMLVL